jgi:hypothetical protein
MLSRNFVEYWTSFYLLLQLFLSSFNLTLETPHFPSEFLCHSPRLVRIRDDMGGHDKEQLDPLLTLDPAPPQDRNLLRKGILSAPSFPIAPNDDDLTFHY